MLFARRNSIFKNLGSAINPIKNESRVIIILVLSSMHDHEKLTNSLNAATMMIPQD